METFIAAYAIVWLALVLYVLRLRAGQRQLEELARTLQTRVQNMPVWTESDSRSDLGA
jgi:CcmD family protein